MNTLDIITQAEITFNHDNGDYGFHNGFFNAVVLLDGAPHHFQCSHENGSEKINFKDQSQTYLSIYTHITIGKYV